MIVGTIEMDSHGGQEANPPKSPLNSRSQRVRLQLAQPTKTLPARWRGGKRRGPQSGRRRTNIPRGRTRESSQKSCGGILSWIGVGKTAAAEWVQGLLGI